MKQVKCHNDVTIVGRIARPVSKCIVNNQKAVQIILKVPNDLDYNLEPNTVVAYALTDDYKMFRGKVGKALAFNGHVECNRGLRIIIDVMTFIKESYNV